MGCPFLMAERKGFEPSIQLPVYSLSRGALSTTQPPLRGRLYGRGTSGSSTNLYNLKNVKNMKNFAQLQAF